MAIQDVHWQVLRQTGTQHLMAISGLHIGLMALLGYGLGLFCVRRSVRLLLLWPAQLWAGLISIGFAVVYAGLAGFAIPTQRALLMVVLVVIAKVWRRDWSMWQILGLAAVLIVLWDPRSILDKGFWLSFTAVGWIFWVLGRIPSPTGWRLWVRMQWALFVGLMPLTLLWFDQVAWVAPLVNLIAIPLVGWVLVPGLMLWAMLVVMQLPAGWVLSALVWATEWGWVGLSQVAALGQQVQTYFIDLSGWPGIGLTPIGFGFVMLALVVLCMPRPLPGRWLAAILILPALFPPKLSWESSWAPELQTGEVEFNVLDVGQGLASVIRTKNHMLVYDVGNAFQGFDLGEQVVVPFLKTRGLPQVDKLMLSHMDQDHAGGLLGVVKNFPVNGLMVLPGEKTGEQLGDVRDRLKDVEPCQAGMRWQWDQVLFEVLYPLQNSSPEKRNLSCVVKVTSKQGSILLAGDIEASMEAELLAEYAAQQLLSEVLLVPHHGSKTSSTTGLINRVSPDHAIISAGWGNAFGHPNDVVLRRYYNRGIQVWNTAEHGMVQVRLSGGDVSAHKVRYSRENRAWPWRF